MTLLRTVILTALLLAALASNVLGSAVSGVAAPTGNGDLQLLEVESEGPSSPDADPHASDEAMGLAGSIEGRALAAITAKTRAETLAVPRGRSRILPPSRGPPALL